MQAIATAIGYVLGKIVAWARFFLDVVIQVFVDLWEFLTDGFVWVFEQSMGLVLSALSALDLSAFQGLSTGWGNLPAQVLEVLGALGLGAAFGIIASAITIRLLLQLVPFTRLGS